MPHVIQFSQLYSVLRNMLRNEIYVNIDKTRGNFINNYGQIPHYINKSDSDPWNVIVPGYRPLNKHKKYRIKELLGVYTVPTGNHKLIIDVHARANRDISTIHRDVTRFQKKYENHTKLKGSVLYFGYTVDEVISLSSVLATT